MGRGCRLRVWVLAVGAVVVACGGDLSTEADVDISPDGDVEDDRGDRLDGDSQVDGDGDVDTDVDGDIDADSDVDGDADTDADADVTCVGVCEPGDVRLCSTATCGRPGSEECGADCSWSGECVDMVAPPTLDDYWHGLARWSFVRQTEYVPPGGVHIEAFAGVWYLFNRMSREPSAVDYCGPISHSAGTEVRASTDNGVTWSAASDVVVPVEGSPWECLGTDGDVWYDASAETWHYLFQCLDRDFSWRGCHVERAGSDPLGPFVETTPNPVFDSGELWSAICDNPEDDCVRIPGGAGRVSDEGTFNIFDYQGGTYFVSFHGYDGVNGYRGVARTADFQTWIAGDRAQGVPDDAIFDRHDASSWREAWAGGSVGGGAASTFREGDYYYMLVEAADMNLGCTANQHWDFGILRSSSLTATTWDQLPAGNPIIYSSRAPEPGTETIHPCNVQYSGIFRDPDDGVLWLHYSRLSVDPNASGTYLSRLEWTRDLLVNGDMGRCDDLGWTRSPAGPTNLVVYRRPGDAPDGTCYMATNCGSTSCEPNQGVYQDVDVSGLGAVAVRFGGTVRSEWGEGDLTIVVHELDTNNAIVATTAIPVHANTTYRSVSEELTLSPTTTTVRFQVYLLSAVTFFLDDLFFETVC